MDQFKFDTSNQYWKDRVKHASDGTKVPGLDVIEELVAELKISSNKDKVLDLGCGQGRIFPVIKHYTNMIFGIDRDLCMAIGV